MSKKLKLLDLFSGIGGFSLAARWTGEIETVGFCEIEPFAQKVLKKHWPNVPIFDDIRSLKNDGQIGAVDIISGGFPCQPFSVAGNQGGKDDHRDLWPEMFRIIKDFKPTWVIGENVAGFIQMELDRSITDLESEGYEVSPIIIPACAVGAPHRRDRVWILAYTGCELREGTVEQKENGTEIEGRFTHKHKRSSQVVFNSDRINAQRIGKGVRTKKPSGLSDRETRGGKNHWAIEPDVGRVANGIPSRVDRLKGLGNAIVPQVAYEILKLL